MAWPIDGVVMKIPKTRVKSDKLGVEMHLTSLFIHCLQENKPESNPDVPEPKLKLVSTLSVQYVGRSIDGADRRNGTN